MGLRKHRTPFLAAFWAASAFAALGFGTPSAGAQGVQIGGGVDSQLGLTLDYTTGGLATFQTASNLRTYQSLVRVAVTATDPGTMLSVGDGDTASAALRGHLQSASGALSPALSAAIGTTAPQPLDTPVDPLLQVFSDPIALAPATIFFTQDILAGEPEPGPFHKTILITVSPASP